MIYEVTVTKDGKVIETSIWETDLPAGQIAKYYKGCEVDVKETKYKQKIHTKAEIEDIEQGEGLREE